MGDLTEKQAGGTTKLVGADPVSGQESFFAEVTSEGELKISSFANINYVSKTESVGTTPELAAVGVSNLTNRKALYIKNKGAQDINYGPSGSLDEVLEKDEFVTLPFGQNIDVYISTDVGVADVVIQEWS